MAKEIRWIKGKLYREECNGNWEPYNPDAPPDVYPKLIRLKDIA